MNKKILNTTLVFIKQGNNILLAKKKRGFAQGTYNGIGGKQDVGESIEQAMVRETQEEIRVTPIEYYQAGLIEFDTWYKGEHVDLNLNIFICNKYIGEPIETEEMKPQWFKQNNIPFNEMMQDDIVWIPKILEGKFVCGKVVFNNYLQERSRSIVEVSKEKLNEKIYSLYGNETSDI